MTDKQTEPHIIKKYANRRLYDTSMSCYITLDQVKEMIIEGIHFKVMDVKKDKDITRNILMQIIYEHEEDSRSLFSKDLLREFIKCYGFSHTPLLAKAFALALPAIMAHHRNLEDMNILKEEADH